MRVFISHSSKDGKAYAKKLHAVLAKRGHDPYLVEHDLCVSEIIWDEIAEEIQKRERSIFVITESSQESKGQKKEYDLWGSKYRKGMAFVSKKAWEMKIVDKKFPWLFPPKGLVFNRNNIEEKCETISTHLVNLQDKERLVQRQEIDRKKHRFPKLTREGLNEPEIAKCIDNLSESYQMETIIPEAFGPQESKNSFQKFWNIGFNYRLPREWFLSFDETHTAYSNDFMFRDFGRNIALGERKYLHDMIMQNKDVSAVEEASTVSDPLERIKQAISVVSANGFKPKIIFPTIDHLIKMYAWRGEAYLKYSRIIPKPNLSTLLIVSGTELKLIEPLGDIPRDTLLFGDGVVKWNLRRYAEHGSIYADIGNDRLYPKKYVQVIAFTTARCEINPNGIVVLKSKKDITKNAD